MMEFYNRHIISISEDQKFYSNLDLRTGSNQPVYAKTGSVLYFQHFALQNVFDARIAVEFDALYTDYRINCTPTCFSSYQLGNGGGQQPWRFLLRAIVATLKSI